MSSTKNYTDGEAYLQWESVKLSPSRTEDNIFIAIHGSLQYKFMDLATRLGDTTMGGRYKLPGYTYEFSNLNGECRRDYTTSIWDEVKYEFWDYQYVVAHDRTKGMASAFKYTFENDRKRIVIHLRPKFKKNILPDLSKPL
ncbi:MULTISPECIES: hypothetical protein [unclassified Dysgonomonas]|uniref:hypothetical protein n=1 Tax=unclassified Dysgonomonas TaxID=2630389 RepID=UPI002476D11E|nr:MULTISPECIES: hypothetical protein [unclassified Dysgonomonas]MDL2303089.1 hypothetical protein [Dysgonomonas sp. OttesenSCG-928-D17]